MKRKIILKLLTLFLFIGLKKKKKIKKKKIFFINF